MKKSLGKKICFIGVALIGFFVLLNIILTYFFMVPFSAYLNERQMKEIVLSIESRNDYSDEKFMEYIESVSDDMNTQVTIIDGKKKIICTTRVTDYQKNKLGTATNNLFDSNFKKIENGKAVTLTRIKGDTNQINIKLIKKIGDNRYAILSRSYRSMQNATYSAIMFDAVVGIILVLIGYVVVSRLSRRIVVPIEKMTVAAEHISNLEFDTKVDIQTEDELGQLGESINKMSGHLEQNLEMLQNDVENRKRLVRNLSHEIKSPVAVIMGYADRLKSVISKNPEKALQYCEIISDESGRVDMLVKEMLDLSKLEQQTSELNIESFTAGQLFQSLHKRFDEENSEKNIQYVEEYDREDWLWADYLLLERAVYNLISNAVFHGNTDKMLIRIRGEKKQDYYEIRVYNSGSFIPDEELSSIWEAFNKVDKVRTRGKQGSGVGLSIVKEVVEAHKGYYSVQNMEDGVEFCIAIKCIKNLLNETD